MHLDEHSDTPFYRQLEAQLREGIESGTYPTCARPVRGGWSRSATSIAPPSKSSCRAARRPAFRTY